MGLLSRLKTDVRYRNFAEDGNQLLSQVVDLVPQLQAPQLQNYQLHSPIEGGHPPRHQYYLLVLECQSVGLKDCLIRKSYFARMLFDCRVDCR